MIFDKTLYNGGIFNIICKFIKIINLNLSNWEF